MAENSKQEAHLHGGKSIQATNGSSSDPQSPSAQSTPLSELVVMAASAGGVIALQKILSALPAGFPIPIAITQHRSSNHPNLLARVLQRHTALAIKTAKPSEPMQPGTVYLAPPDRHMTVQSDGTLALRDGRKIRHVRSSANPLFESAAEVFGKGVIAVVLTGGDRDATDGVQSIKARGGRIIAQDEATSEYFGMPHAAIETGCVDWVLPLQEIGPMLVDLTQASEASPEDEP